MCLTTRSCCSWRRSTQRPRPRAACPSRSTPPARRAASCASAASWSPQTPGTSAAALARCDAGGCPGTDVRGGRALKLPGQPPTRRPARADPPPMPSLIACPLPASHQHADPRSSPFGCYPAVPHAPPQFPQCRHSAGEVHELAQRRAVGSMTPPWDWWLEAPLSWPAQLPRSYPHPGAPRSCPVWRPAARECGVQPLRSCSTWGTQPPAPLRVTTAVAGPRAACCGRSSARAA